LTELERFSGVLVSAVHDGYLVKKREFTELNTGIKTVGSIALLLLSLTACNQRQSLEKIQSPQLSQQMCPGAIAFISEGTRSEGDRAVYTMNADGSNQKILTSNLTFSNYPVWSPNGQLIAFQALGNVVHLKNQIYIMEADGSNLRNLSNSEEHDSLPLWSPNGQLIAFTRSLDLNSSSNTLSEGSNTSCNKLKGQTDIYVMNADGTNQKRLTNIGLDNELLSIPIGWSQDSKKIFFHSFKLCNSETVADLYAVNVDDSSLTRITQLPQYGRYRTIITLSPDRQQIAFEARDADGDMEIYVMNADGSNRRQLTQNTETDEYPSWSPDSKQVAYSRRETLESRDQILSLINVADGLGKIDLIGNIAPPASYSLEKSLFTWSPDGKQILVRRFDNTNLIYVVNVDGSGSKQLTTGEKFIANLKWQPVPCK
jgi:Tol biopolymer transport system component